ncbi:nucleotide disphospho-sugar-binding domain-containing protein [Dactylosporangium sp. NPDC049742]|uniref:glycosyltransferase n=1 Tax=Dactylosporangium sp. NPDC049742 TaxID=3154737 RepID=UPI003424FBFF
MSAFLLVTHGSAGDVLPFVRIGAELRARGHDVTLLTHAPFATLGERGDLEFVAIDTAAQHELTQRDSAALLSAHRPADLRDYYERHGLFDQLRFEVSALADRHRPGGTVLVGRHTSALSVLVAAELLGAPAAWVAVAPVQLMVAPIARAHVRRGLAPGIEAVRGSFRLPPVTDWPAWLTSAPLTLGLWPSWFDRAGVPAPATVRLTDFVTGDGSATGAAVAADPRPLLVTGGTGELLHPRFYPVAIEAAAALDRPVLAVAPRRDLLPARLPSTVEWHARLPFAEVVPRMAAILHHGGIGTAVRAMRAGTPQVVMAHGADRPDNAARLAAHGLARWHPEQDWDPAVVAASLHAAATGPRPPAGGTDDSRGPRLAAEALTALLPLPTATAAGGG